MLLTVNTLILFLVISIAALAIGIFAKRQEPYYLGVILLFFMGLMVLQLGISQPTGSVTALNETVVGNVTAQVSTVTYEYEQMSTVWNTGFGLLFVVLAAGLALHFYLAENQRQKEEADNIEVL